MSNIEFTIKNSNPEQYVTQESLSNDVAIVQKGNIFIQGQATWTTAGTVAVVDPLTGEPFLFEDDDIATFYMAVGTFTGAGTVSLGPALTEAGTITVGKEFMNAEATGTVIAAKGGDLSTTVDPTPTGLYLSATLATATAGTMQVSISVWRRSIVDA